jgi:GntR family transcriptional regulator
MAMATELPKYIQVSEMLIREIAAGHLADGARLAPERDMAEELGLSVGTLRKALADLAAKGLLDRVQGSGNYIRHADAADSVYAFFRLEKLSGGGLPTADVLSLDLMAKPVGAPAFGPHAQAHRIRRLRRLDGAIVALEEIWLDVGVAAQIAVGDLSDSLYHFYRTQLGLVIASVEDRIGVGKVPAWAPPQFPLAPGTVSGFVTRIGRTGAAVPIEFSRTWFDFEKARYVSRMGKG